MKQQNLNQNGLSQGIKRHLHLILVLSSALLLSACGGGASNTQNPNSQASTGGDTTSYNGDPARNNDVTAFQATLFNYVRSPKHCGNCHDGHNGHDSGHLFFADNTNVNDAYDVVTANNLVVLTHPEQSRLVTKFTTGKGHICLDGDNSVCATELTNWIAAWANYGKSGGGRQVNLTAPKDTAPSPPIPLPPASPHAPSSYYTDGAHLSIYTLVSTHCSGCHSEEHPKNDQAISPLFAVTDHDKSYQTAAAVPLINLSAPELSRFYTRLNVDGHNCWSKCADDAQDMLDAINMLKAEAISLQGGVNPLDNELTSRAVYLATDGIEAAGGNRYEANQIALYEFKSGSGDTVPDLSGIEPAMNLTLSGKYEWLSNWGIQFDAPDITKGELAGKAQATPADSSKLQQLIGLTGEYSIEAWVVPANVTQKESNIVSYSGGTQGNNVLRNFTLGQNMDEYEAFNYSTTSDTSGGPEFDTANKNLTASLEHVVLTYDATNGRQLYVNGLPVAGVNAGTPDPTPGGGLSGWSKNYALVLGNETSLDRPWLGAIRLLAIHNHALTPAEVKQNFDVGVGQKYYLLFNISQHLGPECTGPASEPYCFIVMEASQYDNHSYLFNAPRFIDLNDANANYTNSLLIKGMRVAINGVEAPSGQTYANLDVCVNGGCGDANETDASYVQGTGAALSDLGAVIALQNGPKPAAGSGLTPDQIFLTFQQIGTATPTTPFAEDSPTTPYLPPVQVTNEPAVLMHTFEEINASLSQLTGVPLTNAAVNNDSSQGDSNDGTYTRVIQALPSSAGVKSFVSAQQTAITQMAITYCDQLVDNDSEAGAFFPSITFNTGSQAPDLAFTSTDIENIITPLLAHTLNKDGSLELTTMPASSTVHDELASLISSLAASTTPTACGTTPTDTCGNSRTKIILKATCTAAMAASPMLLN
jgi:hypothetical protein